MTIYAISGILVALCVAAIAWYGVRKHGLTRDHEENTADDALRKLYGRYWAEVGGLTHTHLLKAPRDEEWLDGIRARAAASDPHTPSPTTRMNRGGTIYPILARLEALGWVESRQEENAAHQDHRPRRHWRILHLGHRAMVARFGLDQLRYLPPGSRVVEHGRHGVVIAVGERPAAAEMAEFLAMVAGPGSEEAARLRAHLDAETSKGSLKHARVPRWMRWIPKSVMAFDFGLLLYCFAGITNVHWATPQWTNVALATGLAAVVTVLSSGLAAFTGRQMRAHKDHSGTVHLGDLDTFARTSAAGALAVIVAFSVLAFIRMRTGILNAFGTEAETAALVVSLILAVVTAGSNFLATSVYAFDGSDETSALARLPEAARRSQDTGSTRTAHKSSRSPELLRWALRLTLPVAALAALAVGFYFLSLTPAITIVLASLVIFIAAAVVGAVLLVSWGIRREEQNFSLTRQAPGLVGQRARQLTGLYVRGRRDRLVIFGRQDALRPMRAEHDAASEH